MTAATVPNAFTRSQFVRVRALPALNARRHVHIPTAPAIAVSAPSRSEGAAAVQRAVANHTSAARSGGKQKRHDSVEFRLIFSAAFAFFLFTSVIERENVVATQFHPEKSQKHGLALLSRFLEM